MNVALNGGLINKPEDAVAYAHVLIEANDRFKQIPATAMKAEERKGVWHITVSGPANREIMTFSRETGKLLSGDL